MQAFGDLSPAERRRLANVGALLFVVGSATSIPAGLLLDPPPRLYEHVVGLIGITLGLMYLRLPWERMSDNWLHVIPIVGVAEVIAGVAIFSEDYSFFLVLGAMYVAFTVRDNRVLAGYAAYFIAALVAPLTYWDGDRSDLAHTLLVTLPVLIIGAFAVRYFRDTLEKRERQYRVFANEAIALAERIRGGHPTEPGFTHEDFERRLGELSESSPVERR